MGCVSVVVPVFNGERGLKRCLDGVLAQSHHDIEVIVVDDGSTDTSGAIVRSYGERIRLISQQNRGECAARNRGFVEASGEYLSFVDHDDYWEPRFLETCVRFLEEHPEADAVSTGGDHRSALSPALRHMPAFLADSRHAHHATVIANFFNFWAEHNHVCAGSVVLRTRLFDRAGGQREDLVLSGDLEYWAYLATFTTWGFIPEVLLHVDGTQSRGDGLYEKFYRRYSACSLVSDWERRIVSRLGEEERNGFNVLRGRVATWYVFAKVFVGRDDEAYREAVAYRDHLEGRYGRLWRAGIAGGPAMWKLLASAVRARTKLQYKARGAGR